MMVRVEPGVASPDKMAEATIFSTVFWTMSPDGVLYGNMSILALSGKYGPWSYWSSLYHDVRPVISLVSDTTVLNGTGTATDPWTINE